MTLKTPSKAEGQLLIDTPTDIALITSEDSADNKPGNGPYVHDPRMWSADSCNKLLSLCYAIADGGVPVENVNDLLFNTSHTPTNENEGRVWWNGTDHTLNLSSGLGPVLQVGQESWVIVYNNTGSRIDNGSSVYPVGGFGGAPSVALANAETHVKISGEVLVTSMDIPTASFGIATQFGKVRGIDTSSWSLGDTLWVSATTDGALTNVKPEFPDYSIQVGGVISVHATTGEIIIGIKGQPEDMIVNFWNGCFRENFDFRISSNGSVITGSLEPSNGHDDMTMMFSDGFTMLDTSPVATIALTAGTDANPQTNYVYIPKSTKVMTVSTAGWTSSEHIKVAKCILQTAATVQTEGALGNQNVNDAVESTTTFQGHLTHITERIRKLGAAWDNGAEGSASVVGGSAAYVSATAGQVYQMHKQTFPIVDMTPYTIDAVSTGSKTFTISDDGDLSSTFPDGRLMSIHGSTGNDGLYTVAGTVWSSPNFVITVEEAISSAVADGTIGDDIHVVNDYTAAYDDILDLTDVTTDSGGTTLNNTSFSFVVWGVANKTNEPSHLMLNVPSGSYSKTAPADAVTDTDGYSVYDIPTDFASVGFLIARFTFVNNGGTWSLYDTEDLRGKIPNATAGGGGGGGGGGSTTFTGLTDTPSAYSSQALKIPQVNSGESALEFTDSPTLANLTLNGQANSPIQTVTDGASITPDWDSGSVGTVTLAGNRTLANSSNKADGATYILIVKQDANGSRTLAYGTDYLFPAGTAPTLSTAANAVDILTFISDGTKLYGVAQKAFA